MLLNESPYGAGIIPMYRTIQRVLRLSFRLIANVIPSPIILRRSFRFPNDRFGLNESPYGAGIFPMHCTIRRVLRRSFRLIANVIPLPIILRRSFRFPNDRFGLNESPYRAGFIPMRCTIRHLLRGFCLMANKILHVSRVSQGDDTRNTRDTWNLTLTQIGC